MNCVGSEYVNRKSVGSVIVARPCSLVARTCVGENIARIATGTNITNRKRFTDYQATPHRLAVVR